MVAEQEPWQSIDRSLPPEHFLLVCLDLAEGKPLTVKELTARFSVRLAESSDPLAQYIDPEEVVIRGLDSMSRLKFVEMVTETREGQEIGSVHITTLGAFMATGLQPQTLNPEG